MAEPFFRVAIVPDVQFASFAGTMLSADLYLPEGTDGPAPMIVWVHGGGWRFGSRRVAPDLSRFFGERGFAMAAVDYRLSDRALFPSQIEDLKTAIRWLRRVASTYGFDPERIGLMGASAGGHLAALAGLTPDGMFEPGHAPYAEESSRVQAVVAGYPPIDFLQLDADRPLEGSVPEDPENLRMRRGMRSMDADSFESMLLGAPIATCPDRVRDANPVTYAGPGAPPFLIVHGLSDTTIGAHQSEILYDALARHGNDVTLCLIDTLGHGCLNRTHHDDAPPRRTTIRRRHGGEDRTEEHVQPIFPLIEAFFRTHLSGRERDRDAAPPKA